MDFYGFHWISMDFHRFPWMSMDLKGSGTRMSDALWQPLAACCAQPQRIGSPNIKISDSGGLDLEAWCLDAGRIGMDWGR